jgi:hypothetical protein
MMLVANERRRMERHDLDKITASEKLVLTTNLFPALRPRRCAAFGSRPLSWQPPGRRPLGISEIVAWAMAGQ